MLVSDSIIDFDVTLVQVQSFTVSLSDSKSLGKIACCIGVIYKYLWEVSIC